MCFERLFCLLAYFSRVTFTTMAAKKNIETPKGKPKKFLTNEKLKITGRSCTFVFWYFPVYLGSILPFYMESRPEL